MQLIDSFALSENDISSPLLLATYTALVSGEYFVSVNLSLLSGTGVYSFTTTRQIGGTGAIYQSGTVSIGLSAGVTTLTISTIPTPLLAGDILNIYVQGLASDTAIDSVTEIFQSDTIEDIWSSSKRTLTQSPAEIIATVLGADITQIRGDSWAVQLTGVELGSIQQFAIKHSAKQSDSAALLFVDSVNGLTVLNGVTQDGEDSSKASLTYDGTILTLTVDASITAQLPAGSLKYGIQSISNNGIVSEPYGGTFHVLADIVRATD